MGPPKRKKRLRARLSSIAYTRACSPESRYETRAKVLRNLASPKPSVARVVGLGRGIQYATTTKTKEEGR
jgi:hypothetical protein